MVSQGAPLRSSSIDTLAPQHSLAAQVIETSGEPPESVRFGVTVVLVDNDTGEEVAYTLIGEDESDGAKGLISVASPVARALLGKRVDDEVTVRVPKGTRELQIREIRFD